MYTGLIIKESIADDTLLDYIRIIGVEIWKTDNTPRYWTAVSFTSECGDFPEKLSKAAENSNITVKSNSETIFLKTFFILTPPDA